MVRLATFVLLATVVLIMLPYIQPMRSFQRFSTTTTEITDGDLNNRTTNWREGYAAFLEHPIIGVYYSHLTIPSEQDDLRFNGLFQRDKNVERQRNK